MLLLNAMVGLPTWGLILHILEPQTWDPMWIRWLISSGLAVCWILSHRIKKPQKFLEHVTVAAGSVMVTHFLAIALRSPVSSALFCGYLILLSCLLHVLPTKLSTWAFALSGVASGILMSWLSPAGSLSPLLMNVSLLTTVTVGLSANLTRIQQLHTLQSIQSRTQLLFQNMKDGMLVLNPQLQVTMSNPSACKLFGLSHEQLVSTKLSELLFLNERNRLISPEDLPFIQAHTRQEEVRDSVVRYQQPDGAMVWLTMTAVPLADSKLHERHSILLTIHDTTDAKRSQLVSVERQARKEVLAKLTAMGEMAAGVAHEINNPLAIILGKVYTVEKFLQTQRSSEPVEVSLSKISQAVERIKKVVQALQAFATGGEQDPFQSTDLTHVVKEVMNQHQKRLSEQKIQIQLDLEANLNFDCRPNQLVQCLQHLVENSCDAIERQSDRWIRIWARSAHQSLVLTISDSGPGIPEEIREHVMEPFFTTKAPGMGTGLGLSIARGLISSHMGRIWLDSSAVHTTFVVELPLAQVAQKKAA